MSFIDLTIIVVYLGILLGLGVKLCRGNETQEDFFIGGRSMAWLPVALSVAATMISGNGMIGGPGWSYQTGLRAFMQNASVPLVLALVCSCIMPFLYQLRITSCYEYLYKRFGNVSRMFGALGFLLSSLIQVSSMVYIPSLIISQLTGWDIKVVLIVIVIITTVYTLLGGIKAVIWTDVIQMILVWGGLLAIVYLALKSHNLSFMDTMRTASEAGKLNAFDFSLDLQVENGFFITLFGGGIMWLQYFMADQSQVQRMFAVKSVKEVKRSLLSSGIMMNLTYFLLMIIGLIMFSVFNGKTFENTNQVMIQFIAEKVPVGLMGGIVAAIIAAAMSSVDSLLNSMATVFIKDIYEGVILKEKKAVSLSISRYFTLAMAVLVTLFAGLAFMNTTSSILAVVSSYISYLCGGILGMFLLGMLTRRANDFGASGGFVIGVLGTVLVAKLYPINFLWYNVIGLAITMAAGYFLSLLRPATRTEENQQYMLKSHSVTMDKYTLGLLAFAIIQYIVLYLLIGNCETSSPS